MRRKRFKHHVDIFCDMFCGWRLASSYDRLVELGSGSLEIDVLTERCSKDGVSITPLSIAGELGVWFRDDARAAGIELSSVRVARLRVSLLIEPLTGRRRTNVVFPGREETGYVRCQFDCSALLESEGDRYEAHRQDYQEWPSPFTRPT